MLLREKTQGRFGSDWEKILSHGSDCEALGRGSRRQKLYQLIQDLAVHPVTAEELVMDGGFPCHRVHLPQLTD